MQIRENIKLAQRTKEELSFVKATAASQKEVSEVRNELRETQDNIAVAHLDLKTRLWELEQEIVTLREKAKVTQSERVDPLAIKRK